MGTELDGGVDCQVSAAKPSPHGLIEPSTVLLVSQRFDSGQLLSLKKLQACAAGNWRRFRLDARIYDYSQ